MACLDMYNNDPNPNKGGVPSHFGAPMSPRISFSNDFAESAHQQAAAKPSPDLIRIRDASSSDFEFSVGGYSMMSADELFFKGRLLPFKDTFQTGKKGTITTLREELLAGEEDEEDDSALRRPKWSTATRWKGLVGLRKSHIGSKKAAEAKINVPTPDNARHSPASEQEVLDEGGSSCTDMDTGI